MVVTVSPVDQGSKEETFTTLASDFGFDDKVRRLFLEGCMETLEDFRFYFTDEKRSTSSLQPRNHWLTQNKNFR